MKGLYFIPFSTLDFSDEQLYSSHLEKLKLLFQISGDETTFDVCKRPLTNVAAIG